MSALELKCDVQSQGTNCPEVPKWAVRLSGTVYTDELAAPSGRVVYLCERCYQNVMAGAYGVRIVTARPLGEHEWGK